MTGSHTNNALQGKVMDSTFSKENCISTYLTTTITSVTPSEYPNHSTHIQFYQVHIGCDDKWYLRYRINGSFRSHEDTMYHTYSSENHRVIKQSNNTYFNLTFVMNREKNKVTIFRGLDESSTYLCKFITWRARCMFLQVNVKNEAFENLKLCYSFK